MGKNSSGRVPTQEVKVFHPFSTSFISLVVEAYSKPSVCPVRGVAEIIFPPMTRFVSQPVLTTKHFFSERLAFLCCQFITQPEQKSLFFFACSIEAASTWRYFSIAILPGFHVEASASGNIKYYKLMLIHTNRIWTVRTWIPNNMKDCGTTSTRTKLKLKKK